jgi:hypothetical protein
VLEEHAELAAAGIRREHSFKHSERYARLVSEARDQATSRVQELPGSGLLGERIVRFVEVTNAGAIRAIELSTAKHFDPGMLIRRYGLRRELTTDPVGFFSKDDGHAVAESSHSAGAPTDTASDDGHIALKFTCGEQRRGDKL